MHDRCTREERRATFGASFPYYGRASDRFLIGGTSIARADARQSHRTCTLPFFRQHRFQATGTTRYRRRDVTVGQLRTRLASIRAMGDASLI